MHFVVISVAEVARDQLVANLSAACWYDFLFLPRIDVNSNL